MSDSIEAHEAPISHGGSNRRSHGKLSPVVGELIEVFEADKTTSKLGYRFNVSRTISTLAVLYEKARNAVEFRAEHLVRRAAIERILKRRLLLNGGSITMAENLIVELLWARYIDSSLIDENKISEVQGIIERYLRLKNHLFGNSGTFDTVQWESIIGIASSEIDECIVSAKKRQALINFFYQTIRAKVDMHEEDESFINMQTYIAVERAYAQADDPLISYHLLQIIHPAWFSGSLESSEVEHERFIKNISMIESSLRDPFGESLYRYVRRQTAPFLLIRDFFLEVGGKARDLIENETELTNKLSDIATRKYQEIGAKVRRAVVRSIIYIFLTKMVFAFALEAPFDIWISKKLDYLPLAVNALFPPFLLFLVAGLFHVPGADNTRGLVERIREILYEFDDLKNEQDKFTPRGRNRRPILTAVFSVFYVGTFLLSFGLISLMLTKLHFNIASQIIFIFFVTLVSFFAYRIRQSAKEYEMVDRQGLLEPIIDFFFLPILRAGHILSREIAKINIFIFLFDFILEAPLKVIFEVAEEWIRFIRSKKEEII